MAGELVEGGQQAFRPRARLLTTLGAELISSEVVAVIELVRNAWDADAREVSVEFESPQEPEKARLVIRDDGHGMTREILLGPWFEPATSWKAGRREQGEALSGEQSPGGRRRLGSKGVGRFAAQRLGRHLELRTRPQESSRELRAVFDWAAIEHADGYLDEVRVPWTSDTPTMNQGASLTISQLRDVWTYDRFERLRIGLSRLLSQRLDRSGFRIVIVVDGQRSLIEPELDESHAMYSVRGRVFDGGVCTVEYRDQTGAVEQWERRVVWPQQSDPCGPFDFQINAWDLDRPALAWFLEKTGSSLGLRDFRRVIREHAGLSLYRDSFRILPYGEPDNDWLRLDRRRVNNPTLRLSNNQILGQIHLGADINPGLMDQTNREGLVINDPYHHLQHVVVELLSYLEARRFAARRTIPSTAARPIQTALPFLSGEATIESAALKAGDSKGEVRRLLERQREVAAEAVQTYAGLASIGQVASRVFRQLEHPVKQASTELKRLRLTVSSATVDADDVEAMRATVDKVVGILDELRIRMRRFEPLVTQAATSRALTTSWRAVLEPVVDAFREDLARAAIELRWQGDLESAVDLSPGPLQQAAANIIDNATFWLLSRRHGRLLVVEVDGQRLRITNNGSEIEREIIPLVCEAAFTTREGAQGLGLTMSRDVLASAGLRLVVEEVAVGASFLIEPA